MKDTFINFNVLYFATLLYQKGPLNAQKWSLELLSSRLSTMSYQSLIKIYATW